MTLELVHVGRPRDRECIALHDRYAGRIERLGVRYRSRWVGEVKTGGRFSDAHVRQREGRGLLEAVDGRQRLVALDPGGRSCTSEQLATRVGRWAPGGAVLVVGGPLGLDPTVRQRAEWIWSLSALTFPHELVRVLVAEQLYRALSILRGMPYHRGMP
jgi:23S rRNA (pseudouridine1915-N3)-methyltransferase